MYEFLKPLFESGDETAVVSLTYDQLVEKLTGNDNIKLANLASGEYVGKAKHEADIRKVVTERDGLREQLTQANAEIQSYKDMDIDGIKAAASSWEEKYNTAIADLDTKLAEQEVSHRTDMFMSGYQFTSDFAKNGIRAEFEKQGFKLNDDGTFTGAKEWMDQQIASENNKGAFVIAQPAPDPEPAPDPAPKPQFSSGKPTPPAPKPGPGLMEMMRRKNENPEYKPQYNN